VSVEFGLWKIENGLERILPSPLKSEKKLHRLLEKDLSPLGLNLMLIASEVSTPSGRIDLLAIDSQSVLHVIELKRSKTTREIVAQVLHYSSWVSKLTRAGVESIFESYHPGRKFSEDFEKKFSQQIVEFSHRSVLVSTELDDGAEQVIQYLVKNSVPILTIFFRFFEDAGKEFLARSWIEETEENEVTENQENSKTAEEWNGKDFYVAIGEGHHRSWEDCRQYGFVSGGQGAWYHRTLGMLFVGARVFAYVPQKGYVGVGIVEGTKTPIKDFKVNIDGKVMPLLSLPLRASMGENLNDPDLTEYCVAVKWLKTIPVDQAYREIGLFAKQHTACKLRHQDTLRKVKSFFGV